MDVKITADRDDRKLIAEISGDIDHHTSKYIRSEIDCSINEFAPKTLILDFSKVSFMDSSGIGLVMGRYKIMSELSGEVMIANTPVYIKKVMQLAGINKLCRIADISDLTHNDCDGGEKQ